MRKAGIAGADEGLAARLRERSLAWRVTLERIDETETSLLAFGCRDRQSVVLKLIKRGGDEWRSGPVLEAFGGNGVVRVLDYANGAVLLERLLPGRPRSELVEIDDDEATGILADVIGRMSPSAPPATSPTVEAFLKDFECYAALGGNEIPSELVATARRMYTELCGSQSSTRLLHGDLHHRNVLLDAQRGWLAIDPKGVIAEAAYEVGAALRNPCERPAVFAAPATIRKRVGRFAAVLGLEPDRVLRWAFAQAVLAAIWEIEDDGVLHAGIGWIELANAIRPMLRIGGA